MSGFPPSISGAQSLQTYLEGRRDESELGRWDGGKEERFFQPREKGAASRPTQGQLGVSPDCCVQPTHLDMARLLRKQLNQAGTSFSEQRRDKKEDARVEEEVDERWVSPRRG